MKMMRADIFTNETQETNTGWIECDLVDDFIVKVKEVYGEDVEIMVIEDQDGNQGS